MSGIEAAGLVLAVFPIVVSGLQHFTEGLETINNWRRYNRELAKYSRTLETQRIVYLNTIEILFEGIIQSNDEFEAFMRHSGKAFTLNPQYEERLSTRLGRSYGNYNRIIADMLDSLKMAGKELGIDETGQVREVLQLYFHSCGFPHSEILANDLRHQILWDGFSSPERQLKRLKLALSKKVYANLLEEIKEANRELKEFTKDSHILESSRNKRRSKRQLVDFRLIRRQARSLYNVMVMGRSWSCGCRKYHVASLRLEPRPWEEDEGKDNTPHLKFRVLLSKSCSNDGLDVTWKWRKIEIEPVVTSEGQTAGLENDPHTMDISTLSLVSS